MTNIKYIMEKYINEKQKMKEWIVHIPGINFTKIYKGTTKEAVKNKVVRAFGVSRFPSEGTVVEK